MEEGKCKKQYPCKFQSEIVTDVNGYPIYRRRDTGHTVLVHGIELDNRWVVLHNVYLSTKYDAHINVEVCNNIRAVKYLFKYIYKGHDRATIEISCQSENAIEGNVVEIDEIKKYLDCHYVSASEAVWCIFKFDMHERFPTVERLQYHLPNQQMVPMTMMCRKWQHGQPFPERCSQNGSKQTKNRKLHEALHSINSLSNGCGIES
jgi:hypothetical protein